jgi:hypothetical protein
MAKLPVRAGAALVKAGGAGPDAAVPDGAAVPLATGADPTGAVPAGTDGYGTTTELRVTGLTGEVTAGAVPVGEQAETVT